MAHSFLRQALRQIGPHSPSILSNTRNPTLVDLLHRDVLTPASSLSKGAAIVRAIIGSLEIVDSSPLKALGDNSAWVEDIQSIWQAVICRWVTDKCNSHAFAAMQHHISVNERNEKWSPKAPTDDMCTILLSMFKKAKEAAEMKMPRRLNLSLVTASAFSTAFRQLPTNTSTLVSKVVAVHLSSLFDEAKPVARRRKGKEHLDEILKFVQVFAPAFALCGIIILDLACIILDPSASNRLRRA